MPTKLIEVALPLDAINKEAAREKSIRYGHPSTLHLWWSRKPLGAARAILFAQLVDDPSAHPDRFTTEEAQHNERQRLFRIIEQLVPWESSDRQDILQQARHEIERCYPGGPPPIADIFCGGGSIPLEAVRMGLDVTASDLNPVAVLITKSLIELPTPFAGRPPTSSRSKGNELYGTTPWDGAKGLAYDVIYYGEWVYREAQERLEHFYPRVEPPSGKSLPPVAWLWARTVACPNPVCNAQMPLVSKFWLGKKPGRESFLVARIDERSHTVAFDVGHGKEGPPIEATVGRSGATCLVCNTPTPLAYVRAEAVQGRMGSQLIAVVGEGNRQRIYVPANNAHREAAKLVEVPDDIPDTELPEKALSFRVQAYGMTRHRDLFTNRQLLMLCTFSDLIQEARNRVLADSDNDIAYADAITTYLALALDRIVSTNSTLSRWRPDPGKESVNDSFGVQAVPMVWDYAEGCPFTDGPCSYKSSIGWVARALSAVPTGRQGIASQADATTVSVRSAVLSIDPPYFDNIGYADLSDFFYIWLRRTVQKLYPDLFATMLTPKTNELIATPFRFDGSKARAEQHFEDGLSTVFVHAAESSAATDTPHTVYYAFKQKDSDDVSGAMLSASTGWERMLSALLRSGLTITGTWPLRSELGNRMNSLGTNALASSIVLVCRPRAVDSGLTDRRGFQQALKGRLAQDLRLLQSGGIAPVDLAQAAIGPGMAVFSRFTKVVEPDGSAMAVRTALQLINQVLDEVTAEQEGEFDEITRWAIAWYSEYGIDDGPYGRADDLSRAKNVSVDGMVRAGIVKSGGSKVRLLERSELDPRWDPATDTRLTVWEVTQQLIRRLMDDSEASAAELLARVGGLGDAARDLAYRLFQIAESKKWAKEAGPYNALAAAWPELSRRAAAGPMGQGSLQV